MKKKVLLIEDADVDALITRKIIEKIDRSVEFTHYNSGSEGLKYLKSLDSKNYPNLILVDLMMPIMDGFQFLERFEQEVYPKHPDSSIVVLTSSVDKRDRMKLKHLKCVKDFWVKPFSQDMASKMMAWLK